MFDPTSVPRAPRILRGNEDLALSMMPASSPVADVDPAPERDDLRDPELMALSHAYHARLLSSPRPEAIDYDYSDMPGDWDEARDRAAAAGLVR